MVELLVLFTFSYKQDSYKQLQLTSHTQIHKYDSACILCSNMNRIYRNKK
jgi:hypothetical protein